MPNHQQPSHQSKHDFAYDLIPSFFTSPFGFNKKCYGAAGQGSQMHEEVIDLEILREGRTSQTLLKDGLKEALQKDQIEIFMQPIITLPQRKVRFYEIYGRLRVASGKYAPASAYVDMADKQQILGKIDKLVLAQTMQILKQQAEESSKIICYFINIRAHILHDKSFMHSLLKDLARYKAFAHRLVFELPYAALSSMNRQEKRLIKELGKLGCRFSFEQANEIPSDVAMLKSFNVSFIKISADTLISITKSDEGYKEMQSRRKKLAQNKISLIIQNVENEKKLLEGLDFEPSYGQGNLFGRPDFKSVYIPAPQKNFFFRVTLN